MFQPMFAAQLIGIPIVAPTPILDLQADTGVTVSNVDKVDRWADQSGNGYDFTQAGAERPALSTIDGYPCIHLDGVDDWMLGGNWAALNNMDSFTVCCVAGGMGSTYGSVMLAKYFEDGTYANPGWFFCPGSTYVASGYSDYIDVVLRSQPTTRDVWSLTFTRTPNDLRLYKNKSSELDYRGSPYNISGSITSYSNAFAMSIGTTLDHSDLYAFLTADICALRVYSPALNSMQRAAVEQALITRYGVTYP